MFSREYIRRIEQLIPTLIDPINVTLLKFYHIQEINVHRALSQRVTPSISAQRRTKFGTQPHQIV